MTALLLRNSLLQEPVELPLVVRCRLGYPPARTLTLLTRHPVTVLLS